MNTLEQPARRTATCAERAAWAKALLAVGEKLRDTNSTNSREFVEFASNPSAGECQRPGAASDDHTREAAPVSNDSTTPPSSGVVLFPVGRDSVEPRSEKLIDQGSTESHPTSVVELCMTTTCRAVKEADGSWRALAAWELVTIEQGKADGTVKINDSCCPACERKSLTELRRPQMRVLASMARGHREQAAKLRAIGDHGLAAMEEAEAAKITAHATTLV